MVRGIPLAILDHLLQFTLSAGSRNLPPPTLSGGDDPVTCGSLLDAKEPPWSPRWAGELAEQVVVGAGNDRSLHGRQSGSLGRQARRFDDGLLGAARI